MKKYIKPIVEIEHLNVAENILEGSPTVFPEKQNDDAVTPDNPASNLEKENDDWGNIW